MNAIIENFISVVKRSLDFSGRAGRSEYWWFVVVGVAIGVVAQTFDLLIGVPVLSMVFMLAVFVPGVSVSVRRLHDTDRSGWWMLAGLVPLVGALVVLVLMALPGSEAENQFGAKPVEMTLGDELASNGLS